MANVCCGGRARCRLLKKCELFTKMGNDKGDLEEFKTALGLYIEDPWERVKFIFLKNHHGEPHPDLLNALQSAEVGFVGGLSIGGFIHQKRFLREIKERSDANVYHNKMDAYRQMSRESMKGFLKGGFKWGSRAAIFMGGFTLFTSCVEAYRNKHGIVEYIIGGSMIGGFLRSTFGIRGVLAGSLVGSILGTVYGITHLGVRKLTGQDGIELRYAQYSLSKYLDEKRAQKFMEKKEHELGIPHNFSDSGYLNALDALSDDKEPEKKTEENLDSVVLDEK